MDLDWASQEFNGKVRLVLFFPPSYIFVGLDSTLQLWDVVEKVQKHEYPLNDGVLLDGCVLDVEPPQLWILLDTGYIHGFRVEDFNIVWIRDIQTHDKCGSIRGVVAAFGAQIASSLGGGVDVRSTKTNNRRVIKVNMADIFEAKRFEKEVTAVGFVTRHNLIILSYEAGLLVSYNLLSETRSIVVTLPFHPSRMAFSRAEAVLALYDPFEGTFLYDLATLEPSEEAKVPLVFTQAAVLPAYLTYSPGGELLVIADGSESLRLYPLKPGHKSVYKLLSIGCARFYGITVYQLQNKQDTLWVASISRPVLRSTKWQMNIWAIHDIEASIKNCTAESGELLQLEQCTSYEKQTLCLACWEARELCNQLPSADECRFVRFRLISQSPYDNTARFPEVANVSSASRLTEAAPDMKDPRKVLTAPFLLPLLAKVLDRLAMHPCYFRELKEQKIFLCDICAGSVLFDAWICRQCGYEICGACYIHLPTSDGVHHPETPAHGHNKISLFPLCFQRTQAIHAVHSWLPRYIEEGSPLLKALGCRTTPTTGLHSPYTVEDLDDSSFAKLYHGSFPFLISNFMAPSTPQRLFSDLDYSKLFDVEFFDGSAWKMSSSISLELFFDKWEEPHMWPRRIMLTDRLLRNSSDIRQKLLADLQSLCPSLFSQNPRMGLLTYILEKGSGRHLEDISISIIEKDSILNDPRHLTFHPYGLGIVLLHSTTSVGDQSAGAVYDIWPSSSLPYLSAAVDARATEDDCTHGFPILAKKHSIDDSTADHARHLGGQSSWRYEQQPGQAIFIPPGSPYQVTHQSNCIFASIPIVSVLDIPDAMKVIQAQRYRNLKANNSKIADTLGLEHLVWHVWE